MRQSCVLSLVVAGLASGVINACQPARPLARKVGEDQYGFHDRHTGRVVGGPYQIVFNPITAEPLKSLPRRSLSVELDTVGHQLWLINAWGKRVERAFIDDGLPDAEREGLRRYINEAGQVGFINRRGRVQIPAQYTVAFAFYGGFCVVGQGCRLEPICPGGDMEHAVWRGGRWGVIDRHGRAVVPLQYDALFNVALHDNWLVTVQGTDTVLIKRGGRRLSPRPYQAYTFRCNSESLFPAAKSDSLAGEEREAGSRGWGP